jgi:hypothetical protein
MKRRFSCRHQNPIFSLDSPAPAIVAIRKTMKYEIVASPFVVRVSGTKES